MDEVDDYLWEVYQRVPTKLDSFGDFTWKDPAAAKRFGISMPAYVIGGMDPDFREQLYHAGRAMDAAGIRWSILSAFRDDYRQRHRGDGQYHSQIARWCSEENAGSRFAPAVSAIHWHFVDRFAGRSNPTSPGSRSLPADRAHHTRGRPAAAGRGNLLVLREQVVILSKRIEVGLRRHVYDFVSIGLQLGQELGHGF